MDTAFRFTTIRLTAAGLLAVLTMPLGFADSAGAQELSFGSDVRPILSDKCYYCHGPDADNREADLRLDLEDASRDAIESGEVMRRILSDDPDEMMPPPYSNLSLTDADKATVDRWVQSGAKYEVHWAFRPLPDEVAIPEKSSDWVKRPLDAFVIESLKQRDLTPQDEASPARWLRRLTFDLTGLPPKPEEIDAFERRLAETDDREAAYAAEVDRLLASPAYGEHQAVAWLDTARYADSYGYQSDRLNTQWPYRDWVVRAFNDNLPYDDFLTWQLAGDLLENPTEDQRLATAFNRIHRLNNEGGAVFEEWRLENVADRVHTFGTAVLGLTLECSRCHDHKYDPISQRDYYSLSAFFNSIDENGVYDNSEKVPVPSLLLPTDEQAQELERAERAVAEAEAAYQDAVADAEQRLHNQPPTAEQLAELPDLVLALGFDTPYTKELKETYFAGKGDANAAKALATVEVTDSPLPRLDPELTADGGESTDEAAPRLAVRLDGERGVVMPGVEAFDRWSPFSMVLSLRETKRSSEQAVIAQVSRGQLAFNGWDLTIADGFLESRMYRVWPGNAIGVRAKRPIPVNRWTQITATYDGGSRAAGLRIFVDGEELETEVLRDHIWKRAQAQVMHGGKLTIGQRFRDRGLDGGLVDDVRVYSRALSPTEIAHLATGEPIAPTPEQYASALDADARDALATLTEARKTLVMTESSVHEIPVMDEQETPRETHVLHRGAYDAPRSDETLVTRNTFTDLAPPFPANQPRDRLGLAAWATDPSHPLTSRVTVNRLWANFFGAGLVRTPENFGLQGETPTHPELLDWLARDFVASGWDVKRFCKQIALSATYRQDSRATDNSAENDRDNRWLARGPAHRLSAEQIRDLALAASGRLNAKRGGPPVSPYQPGDDLWRESNSMSPSYEQSVGDALYRRSLYSVWKRTAPLPNMMAFDSETREVCTVKRARTNTPLQALVLLNDVQFLEAARSLAERALQREGDSASRIAWAFATLTGRQPDETERRVLVALHADELEHYAADTEAAETLLSLGDSEPADGLDKTELAAMTIVCRTVLNLDATVWKR